MNKLYKYFINNLRENKFFLLIIFIILFLLCINGKNFEKICECNCYENPLTIKDILYELFFSIGVITISYIIAIIVTWQRKKI